MKQKHTMLCISRRKILTNFPETEKLSKMMNDLKEDAR